MTFPCHEKRHTVILWAIAFVYTLKWMTYSNLIALAWLAISRRESLQTNHSLFIHYKSNRWCCTIGYYLFSLLRKCNIIYCDCFRDWTCQNNFVNLNLLGLKSRSCARIPYYLILRDYINIIFFTFNRFLLNTSQHNMYRTFVRITKINIY